MIRACIRCGYRRGTNKPGRLCDSCRRVLAAPTADPEPYTGGWTNGVVRKPIKEHA